MVALMLALMVKDVLAAPKNTLPPGFHSTPLEQPQVDEPPEQIERGDINAPLELDENNRQSLLDEMLLLPQTTGLLYGSVGLGENIWLESDEEVLQELLKNWQVVPRMRPAALLARRLLLTQALTPTGADSVDRYQFLAIRLEKLYQLGDLLSVERLFNLYPVLTSRPTFNLLYQKLVFSKYANSARAARDGCALWRAARSGQAAQDESQDEAISLQIEALCLTILGQTGLGLSKAERLSDLAQAPREFFPLLARAAGGSTAQEKEIATPAKINNLLWTLYKANKIRPRAIAINSIESALVPIMARDRSLPHGWRLALTQKGILGGIIAPHHLQAFYKRRQNELDDFVPPPTFNRSLQKNKAAISRISNILSNAPTRVAYMASLYAWGRDIANLRPSAGYRRIDGLAAALLLNDKENLTAWLGQAKQAEQPLPIQAMKAVMQDRMRRAHRGVSPQAVQRWREKVNLLINIAGAEFFAQSTSGLPDSDDTQEGDAIIEAADDKKRTEVLLRVLTGLDNPALAREPSFLRAVVQGLRAVGLSQDAWQIMIDSFLTESWGI